MKIISSHDVRAIFILIILWAIFFWRLLTPIPEDQASFKHGDFSGQFVAFGAYQYDRLSQGEIPLWNPYNNGGFPFIADTQAAVFYPPRLLTIAIATQIGGWSYHALELEAIFHILVYSLMMYLFVRRLTKSVWGAFVSSIVAAYGGFISGYPPLQLALLEASIWLPLSALCVLEGTRGEKIKWVWIVFAGVVLGLSWMAGHPQTSWFLTYLLVAWLAYRVYINKLGWFGLIGGTGVMGLMSVGISAVTLLPGLEYLPVTIRSGLAFEDKGNGFPFQDIIQLIFPGSVSVFSPLYVGIPALILIFVAVRYHWQSSRFWFGVAIFSLALSFGANASLYYALYNVLPGLRFFRGQERAAFLFANSCAILAGIGMSYLATWSNDHDKKSLFRFMSVLLVVICGLTALIYIGWLGNIGDGFGRLISPTVLSTIVIVIAWALFKWQMRGVNSQYPLMLIVLLIVFELFSVNMDADSNYNPIPSSEQLSMTPPSHLQAVIDDSPSEPFRVDGFRGVQANYGSLYQVMDIRGISPLFLESAWNIINRNYVNNPRAWEVFAVRYVFSEREFFEDVETTVITNGFDHDGQVIVHEIVNPRSFAHLVYEYALVGSDAHAVELLFDPNFPVRNSVILQTEPSISLPETVPTDSTATIITFEPESTTIEVSTSEDAILSLALIDYAGWQARVDGESVDILRAYGSLSAVVIPSGDHVVTLTYQPISFQIGAFISAVSWAIVFIIGIWAIVNNQRQEYQEMN